MSTFSSQIITEEGMALLSGAISGSSLMFTRMELSDGAGKSASIQIDQVTKKSRQLDVEGTFSNADVSEGFWAKEFKLYASQGKDSTEVIFSSSTDSKPDYVPPITESSISATYTVLIAVSNVDSIQVEAPSGRFVTMDVLKETLGGQVFSLSTDGDGNVCIELPEP